MMGYISGLQEYLDEHYSDSIYKHALQSGDEFVFHAHNSEFFSGKVITNGTYDVEIEMPGKERKYIPKTSIKCIYSAEFLEKMQKEIKTDPKIAQKNLAPIIYSKERNHVKNKSLYPLMEERQVLLFYLLEGEIIKGVIAGFSRYEINVHIKGGLPMTIFRHAIFNITDKKNRSYLKKFQEQAKDWKKSQLYILQSK